MFVYDVYIDKRWLYMKNFLIDSTANTILVPHDSVNHQFSTCLACEHLMHLQPFIFGCMSPSYDRVIFPLFYWNSPEEVKLVSDLHGNNLRKVWTK